MRERDEDMTWRVRGVCQSVDPEVFFPAPSEPADAAVALCRTCDVQGACLAWALQVGDCHGVWGATTPRERRAMLVAWHSDEVQNQVGELASRSAGPGGELVSRSAGSGPTPPNGAERGRLPASTPARPVVLLPTPRMPVREREMVTTA